MKWGVFFKTKSKWRVWDEPKKEQMRERKRMLVKQKKTKKMRSRVWNWTTLSRRTSLEWQW